MELIFFFAFLCQVLSSPFLEPFLQLRQKSLVLMHFYWHEIKFRSISFQLCNLFANANLKKEITLAMLKCASPSSKSNCTQISPVNDQNFY